MYVPYEDDYLDYDSPTFEKMPRRKSRSSGQGADRSRREQVAVIRDTPADAKRVRDFVKASKQPGFFEYERSIDTLRADALIHNAALKGRMSGQHAQLLIEDVAGTEFLNRIALNFLRHRCTEYDRVVKNLITEDTEQISKFCEQMRNAVTRASLHAYPELAEPPSFPWVETYGGVIEHLKMREEYRAWFERENEPDPARKRVVLHASGFVEPALPEGEPSAKHNARLFVEFERALDEGRAFAVTMTLAELQEAALGHWNYSPKRSPHQWLSITDVAGTEFLRLTTLKYAVRVAHLTQWASLVAGSPVEKGEARAHLQAMTVTWLASVMAELGQAHFTWAGYASMDVHLRNRAAYKAWFDAGN